jgi:hypothetical protein
LHRNSNAIEHFRKIMIFFTIFILVFFSDIWFQNCVFPTFSLLTTLSLDEHGHIRRPMDHALLPQQTLKTQISSSTSNDSTSSPKHFFSPIKKPPPPPPRSGPDVFVHNAMANENPFVFTQQPTAPLEPIYAAIAKNSGSMSPSAFQVSNCGE